MTPRYPVYVPSKGRFEHCYTAKFLTKDRCPFYLVVEPQEEAQYRSQFPNAQVLVLPWNDHRDADGNKDGLIAVRNWVKAHATDAGFARHWQIDDNCASIKRVHAGKRLVCDAGVAFAATEDFVDRYENVAVAGLNYGMFIGGEALMPGAGVSPFRLNCHVYSCSLILNSLPNRWRLRYNDDTDFCLQVLASGWCTVQMQAFVIKKLRTMTVSGGNTEALYQGECRLQMARMLERAWPGVVKTGRRFGRPQHVVNWKKFDTPLIRKPDAVIPEGPNEYGMVLKRVKPERVKKHGASVQPRQGTREADRRQQQGS